MHQDLVEQVQNVDDVPRVVEERLVDLEVVDQEVVEQDLQEVELKGPTGFHHILRFFDRLVHHLPHLVPQADNQVDPHQVLEQFRLHLDVPLVQIHHQVAAAAARTQVASPYPLFVGLVQRVEPQQPSLERLVAQATGPPSTFDSPHPSPQYPLLALQLRSLGFHLQLVDLRLEQVEHQPSQRSSPTSQLVLLFLPPGSTDPTFHPMFRSP